MDTSDIIKVLEEIRDHRTFYETISGSGHGVWGYNLKKEAREALDEAITLLSKDYKGIVPRELEKLEPEKGWNACRQEILQRLRVFEGRLEGIIEKFANDYYENDESGAPLLIMGSEFKDLAQAIILEMRG